MDLKTKVIRSMAWFIGTRLWVQGLSWAVTIVLARLLSPSDYGVYAMALAVIALLELFQEYGLSSAIIQRQGLTKEQINTLFWIAFIGSLVVGSVGIGLAGMAAAFYQEPQLRGIIQLLCVIFLLNAVGMIPYSLLTKEIDFKQRSLAEAYGVITGSLVSLGLAWMGYGVWALVLGHLVRAVVKNVCYVMAARWWPGLTVSFQDLGDLLRFSIRVAGANAVTNTLSDVATVSLIGRILGQEALGFYSMAGSLGKNNPIHKLSTQLIAQLCLPIFSKVQHSPQALQDHFLTISKYLALIAFPVQTGLALVAHDVVLVLLTAKWLPMVPIFQLFCLGGLFYVLPLLSAPLLTARDRTGLLFRYSLAAGIALPIAMGIGAFYGELVGAGIAWLAAFGLSRVVLLWLSLREVDISLARYWQQLMPSCLAALGMAVTVLAVAHGVSAAPAGIRLGAEISAGALSYGVLVWMRDRQLSQELRSALHMLVGRPAQG